MLGVKSLARHLHAQATERLFFEMAKLDLTPDDLQCVLKHCLAFNRKHPNTPMKIQVHKLCGDLEVFCSILGEARAMERNRRPAPTPKEQVLRDLRGPTDSATGNGCHRLSEFINVPKGIPNER